MRISTVLAAATALLWAVAPVAHADPCTVGVKLSAPKKVVAGRKFTASVTIKNTATAPLDSLYFQLQLPDYMQPMAGRASAFATKNGPALLLEGHYVYLRDMRLPARKQVRIKVTVGVPTCQAAGSVQLQGLAYRLDGDGNPTCTSTVQSVDTTVTHKRHALTAKNAITGNCTVPTPGTEGFALVGTNTRCLQAAPLEPLSPVRALTMAEEERGRQLMPTASSAELQCWTCCGAHLGATGPYYFNVAADGQCYCCLECDPIYSPAWTVGARRSPCMMQNGEGLEIPRSG
jgi:hypothetical protein